MPLHIAFNLITSLEKCKCPVCQKELKKIKEKYGLDQVNKGQDVKEELIKYVMERADQCYYDDFPIYSIEIWINEFFDQLQPERLNPEDIRNNVSDSPTSENK
jgi:hypothetical protein